MAQPCRGSKKPIRRKAGSTSLGSAVPGLPAVARGQDHAAAGVRVGVGEAAGRPAASPVEKADRAERASHAGGLPLPLPAAVVGVPDDAPVADRPALLGIDETQVVQPGVAAGGIGAAGYDRQQR